MKKILSALIFLLFFVSPLSALTGNPTVVKVVINSTDKPTIKNLIVSDMLQRNLTIYKDTDYQLMFDKSITNFAGFLFMNVHTGQFPVGRLVFNSVVQSGTTLVTVVYYLVENAGSAREIQNVIDHKEDIVALQKYLYTLKSRIDGTPLDELLATLPKLKAKPSAFSEEPERVVVKSGIKGITPEGYISGIEKGSLAAAAGLEEGDLIIEINGRPADLKDAKKMLSDMDSRIDAGRTVIILFERNRDQDMATLKRKP